MRQRNFGAVQILKSMISSQPNILSPFSYRRSIMDQPQISSLLTSGLHHSQNQVPTNISPQKHVLCNSLGKCCKRLVDLLCNDSIPHVASFFPMGILLQQFKELENDKGCNISDLASDVRWTGLLVTFSLSLEQLDDAG